MTAPSRERSLEHRLAVVGVAVGCALVSVGVGTLFGVRGDDFVGLGGAWTSVTLALALEPDPRGPRWRTALAAVIAALLGAVVGLSGGMRGMPDWYSGAAQGGSLGFLATCAAWVGTPFPGALVVATALLPGPALVLTVRRSRRQLEWQAGATAAAVLFAAVALAPGDLDHPALALSLLLSGLPPGLGMYLLDRRALGAEALPVFPAGEVACSRRARALLALAALGALAWSLVVGQLGPRLISFEGEPGCPDLAAVLEDVRARQAAHVARTGAPARTLGALEGLPADVAGGFTQGYVLRYGRLEGDRWVVAADPIPARMGWPSLRLVGPDGVVERSFGPLRLEVP